MNAWFPAGFGDYFPLRITRITTDDGRDIVVQSPSRGSKHYLSDRGAKLGRVEAEIVFVDEPGVGDFRERFNAFRTLIQTGQAQLLTHPLLGVYLARCEGGSHTLDETRKIVYSVTFLPEEDPPTVSQVLAGTSPIAGAQAVQSALSNVTYTFDAMDLSADVAAAKAAALAKASAAAAKVAAWNDEEDLDSQDVIVGVQSITSDLNQAIDDLEFSSTPDLWPGYVAMVNLIYAVSRASDALVSTTDRMAPLTVGAPTPLLAICTQVYGADRAVEMADAVARRNRLRTPGLVPAGTVLAMPGL